MNEYEDTHQLLVLVFHFQSGGNTVPRLHERLSLRMLSNVMDEEAHSINTYVDYGVPNQLE